MVRACMAEDGACTCMGTGLDAERTRGLLGASMSWDCEIPCVGAEACVGEFWGASMEAKDSESLFVLFGSRDVMT